MHELRSRQIEVSERQESLLMTARFLKVRFLRSNSKWCKIARCIANSNVPTLTVIAFDPADVYQY